MRIRWGVSFARPIDPLNIKEADRKVWSGGARLPMPRPAKSLRSLEDISDDAPKRWATISLAPIAREGLPCPGPGAYFTPDTQQLFVWAWGTACFSQHLGLGPWIVLGFT